MMAKATQIPPRWCSRKEAALALGFTRQRLERLIKEGRIEETAKGIDVEKAARVIAETRDPVRRAAYEAVAGVTGKRVAVAQQRRRPIYKTKRGAATAPSAAGDGQGEFVLGSYAEARAERERANAKTAALRYEQLIGTMMPRAEVAAKEFAVARMVRDRIIGFPARLANYVPPEAMKMIADECDRLVRELQEGAAKIAESAPLAEE